MKTRRPRAAGLWSVICAVIASTLIAAPFGQVAGQEPSARPADDPDAGLFTEMCSQCHDTSPITAMRRTKSDWQEVLTKMIEKGATGSEADFQKVFGYLQRHHGKVYINAAPADDITMSLGLSKQDADAIVAYRTANGPFKDLDAVKMVPGIDVKTLDAHKDAVAF